MKSKQVSKEKHQFDMEKNHKNAYPHFVANQILRSSALNNYFSFLDEQTRLSRVHLMGCGIVDGLDFTITEDALIIDRGVAVNRNGWLVEIPERTEYRWAARISDSDADFCSDNLDALKEEGGSHIKMICFKTEDDAKQVKLIPEKLSNLVLDKYVVALAFGKRKEFDSRCSHDSCDLNTAEQVLETWPVLIDADDVQSLYQRIPSIGFSVLRRKEPCFDYYHGDVDSFNGQILKSVCSWESEVYSAMDRIGQQFKDITMTAWNQLFPDEDLVAEFVNAKTRIHKLRDVSVKKVQDYYISFFSDMAQALNEFIDAFNAFSCKYEMIPNHVPSDHLIYLGLATQTDRGGKDIYRSIFRAAMDDERERVVRRIKGLLRRISVLSKCFVPKVSQEDLNNQPCRLLKVRPGGSLASRPVPFYYDCSKEEGFTEYWSVEDPLSVSRFNEKVENAYFFGAGSMNDDGWSLYPVAYQGQELSLVKGELQALNNEMRLSIEVVEAGLSDKVELDGKNVTNLRETFASFLAKNAKEFIDKFRKETSGEAFNLASILGESYDNQFMDFLQGKGLVSDESYRGITETGQIEEKVMKELARALFKAQGKSTSSKAQEKAIDDLSSALLNFFRVWKSKFISTEKGVSLDEISKVVSLAPIRRGCRVFLFTRPDESQGDSCRRVVSYGVVFRSQANAPVKVRTKTYPLMFRMWMKDNANEGFAKDLTDPVEPYSDGGKWIATGNEITFCPFMYDGTEVKMYATAMSNIVCEIPNSEILVKDRIELIDNKYPAIILKMNGNGVSWVSLKIKDDDNNVLHTSSFTVDVNNPEWNRIPVKKVALSLSTKKKFSSTGYFEGQSLRFSAEIMPIDATNQDIKWSSKNPAVASVSQDGYVQCLKMGSTSIKVEADDGAISDAVSLKVSAFVFRASLKKSEGGDSLGNIPETVCPYDGRWSLQNNMAFWVPFSDDGNSKQWWKIPNGSVVPLFCDSSNPSVVTAAVSTITFQGGYPDVIALTFLKNGCADVTVRARDPRNNDEFFFEKTYHVEVKNPKWDKTRVTGVSLEPTSVSLYEGQTRQLVEKVLPSTAEERSVNWSSDKPSIARVDASGLVTAIGAGTAIITVKTVDGSKTASATFKVMSIQLRGVLKSGGFDDVTDTIRLYGDKWGVPTPGRLSVVPWVDDGNRTDFLRMNSKYLECTNSDSSVIDVKVSSLEGGTLPEIEIVALKNGKSTVTATVKDPNGSGQVVLLKSFTIEVNNPVWEWGGIDRVSILVEQQAAVLRGSKTVKIRFEGTAYEFDLSGNKTGKTQTISIEEAFSDYSNWNAYLSAPDHWYFLDKIRVILQSRPAATVGFSWKTVREGYIDISKKKVTLKLTGHYLEDNLNLGGSASEGYSLFMK